MFCIYIFIFITVIFVIFFSFFNFFNFTDKNYFLLQTNYFFINKNKLNTIYFCFWKFILIIAPLLLWISFLYKNDTDIFVRFKHSNKTFGFFFLLISLIFFWAFSTAKFLLFFLTECCLFICLFKFASTRQYYDFFFKNSNFFFSIKFKLFILTIFLNTQLFLNIENQLIFFNSSLYQCIIIIWYFSWDSFLKQKLLKKEPLFDSFVNSVLRSWLLVNFCLLSSNSICIFFLIIWALFSFFYSNVSFREILAIPGFAWKRGHKVVMFGEAPIAVEPDQLIVSVPFNSNIFFILTHLNNILFTFLPIVFFILPNFLFNYMLFFIFFHSIFGWLAYFTSSSLTLYFKTSDVLDWRGLFLVLHQYHWLVKYTLMAFLLSFLFILNFSIVLLISITNSMESNFSLFFIFFILIITVVYIFYHFYLMWTRIMTYFQRFTYEYWNDKFWTNLSPFLRDFLYWKPICPDDYDEPDPSFYGYFNKMTTKFLISALLAILFVCVYTQPTTILLVNKALLLFFYKLIVVYYLIRRIYYVYDFDLYTRDLRYLRDYAYFESYTHMMCVPILIFGLYIVVVHIPYGVLISLVVFY